jgi:Asp-tRNA(Asn)/Glu-tRNA(Gln) amidotransferase A subunit family amidase
VAEPVRTDDRGDPTSRSDIARRRFLELLPLFGAGAAVLPEWMQQGQQPEAGPVTKADLDAAERIMGLDFSDEEDELALRNVNRNLRSFEQLRALDIPLDTEPALTFDPRPAGFKMPEGPGGVALRTPVHIEKPAAGDDLAFLGVAELSRLVATRQVSPVELTQLYLERLRRYDPMLFCVITYAEERALAQARRAEREIVTGARRGPLHGIPWGAKDLLAARGYRTTWGAKPYEEQVIDYDATVVERLDAAGAILVAKLTMGALAMGDRWYGERTRNPWNPDEGSSGSSAGPASATAAGLVGFGIGSETLGSIMSPSAQCGVVGLRPTYGRISRYGAMALSWSMDKLGPLCRRVEDAALVFDAVRGSDGRDTTVVDAPFAWGRPRPLREYRIGYIPGEFEGERMDETRRKVWAEALATLHRLGAELEPITLPELPIGAIRLILNVEASAAFDDLVRSGRVKEMVSQSAGAWPNTFRTNRFVPAVEFIRAQRARRILMQHAELLMRDYDAFVTPNSSGSLTLTNLTGHPALAVPCGFDADGDPMVLMFTGRLYEEATILDIGWQYEQATEWHTRKPDFISPPRRERG